MTNPERTVKSLETSTTPQQLTFHFVKGSNFRVVHANGAWLGWDAQKNIHLSFYNERAPIPKKIVVNLNDQGQVTGEDFSKRESKDGIVREIEVDIVLTLEAALQIQELIRTNIENLQKLAP